MVTLSHSEIQFLTSLFAKLAKMQLKAVSGRLNEYMVTVENNEVRISCTATRLSYLMLTVVE